MHQVLLHLCDQTFVVLGGIPKVDCPEMQQTSGLLKTFLTDDQKQLEALDTLQEITHTTEGPHSESFIYPLIGDANSHAQYSR